MGFIHVLSVCCIWIIVLSAVIKHILFCLKLGDTQSETTEKIKGLVVMKLLVLWILKSGIIVLKMLRNSLEQ